MLDLQTYLDNAVKAKRAESLAKSDQLTLGEIIAKIEPIAAGAESFKKDCGYEPIVMFDFGNLHPSGIDSWRGIYAELALNYTEEGNAPTVTEFLTSLKEAVGKTYTGYKGGEFTMSRHTPVWVANYGNSGNTAVIEIINNGYVVIIITGYRET